ncbi:phosphate signaling complex protein PhoU [Tessaracoccus timonensis]|uniref:phosphate signaling complex protein PhoU n=1 Tax=Tessaracoccus timonensis TaxID=2161816 RepID=UPI000D54D0E8|nr:phosphate signaling complex protein PhoU [Tessaracoccus timonensis]
MRTSYHEELDGLLKSLLHMAELVETALEESTAALFEADINRAEAVISNDAELDQLHEKLEYECLSLLALQAPVAGELRTVVSAIRMVFELARMGDLAAHIAKIARLRYPNKAVPASLEPNFRSMSEIALKMIDVAREALANRDAQEAYGLADIDTKMDDLRREHFNVLLDENWNDGIAAAVDVALIGRYYERFADHAVAVGRRTIYLITGEVPEGEDWPNA